jgi:hypothetical protein
MSSHAMFYPSLRRRRRAPFFGRTAQHVKTLGLAREVARALLALVALAAWVVVMFLIAG